MRSVLPGASGELTDDDLAVLHTYRGRGRWLRANMIASIDGAVTVAGRSGGLAGSGDKRLFRVLRSVCDAIVVGAGTARHEGYDGLPPLPEWGPRRQALGLDPAPLLVLVTRSADLDPESRLFTGPRRPAVVTCGTAPQDRVHALRQVADVVVAGGDEVDLAAGLGAVAERAGPRLLCEGGPRLLHDVAAAGLLDELCLTVAPMLVAGGAARVLTGVAFTPPLALRLAGLLEDDGFLFARYQVTGSRAPD